MALAVLIVVAATPVFAQIGNFTASKNAGNSPDELVNGAFISYQRISAVTFSSSGITGTARYAAGVGADTGFLSNWTEVLNADYTVTFDVTAPGAYDLDISTSISGAFTLVNDGDAAATGSATAVTYSGGVLASGDLGLASPGSLNSNTGGDVAFLRTNSAQIQGVSNGVPQTHSFRFTWTMQCAGAPGGFSGSDECAVRLGLPLTFTGQTAGAYPGVGSRVQAEDGHFFSVHYVSLCGDGAVQGARGEQCDQGANNGLAGACCSSTCQLVAAGTVCRADGGICDVAEVCDGASATCPADLKRPSGFDCRAAAGVCDAAESCDGMSDACPADVKSAAVCRGAAGVCDVAEACDGVSDDCPADSFEPSSTLCRGAAGACDVAESCSGSSADCPADSVSGAFVSCRPSAGICDVGENCDGVNTGCPADTFESAVTVCRAASGTCDVAENCTGSSPSCPTDAFEPATTVCRASSGTCDVAENCSGSSPSCPVDTGGPDSDSDTVCDAIDNCQSIANPTQDNSDGDPLGDACDPCTNIAPTGQEKAKLTLSKLLAPANDESVSFSSFFTNLPTSPTIDPVANGARFLIVDSTGATPVDIIIPGGAYDAATKSGWKVNGSGTSWTYKNSGTIVPLVNGMTKVAIKAITKTPGKYKTQVKGRNGNYPVNPANLPLVPTIVIDAPVADTGQCGEAMFPATPPAKPSCAAVSGGRTVKCK
ncbi:MAG TPA: hypothetical protein VGR62_21545 [Candidatus Binatia bacterium]|nr:hypothetical protein [Candidatus Binatia bacterium]